MIVDRQEKVTPAVLEAMSKEDGRLRGVMTGLAAHLHFLGFKRETLITQMFVDDDCYLDSDVVFGVTRALIGDYRTGSGTAQAPNVKGPWVTFAYTFVMEPGDAVLPHPSIK